MPRYSDQLINEVISENDIVDYVSQFVRLKSNGRDYVGLCPFHKEKSPSFHVSRDKQVFHCFGCGAGGGLMQFVMRIEGLDFTEALKLLADRAGIVLPEEGDIRDDKKYRQKQRIFEINKIAARFFYDVLTKTDEGKVGLSYLYKRGITPKTIISYGLGYAPQSYDALLGAMRKKGYSDNELADAGVIVKHDSKVYDRFNGRVMFPIIDLRGNVLGFGGRIISDSPLPSGKKPAKYLNTSNTPVFDKGRNLFSLNLAKKSNERRMILCEGYMDVISVYQAGIPNIVATLGTAFTENQAKLLSKYCDEILLCYDSDDAGKAATRRAIEIINSIGAKARVIEMKDAKDPDEYIRTNGAQMFKNLMDEAPSSSEYLIKNARKNFNLDSEDGKIGYVSKAVESLVNIRDSIEVDAYIKKIAKESEISVDAIYAEYKKKVAVQKTYNNAPIRKVPAPAPTQIKKPAATRLEAAELRLLGLCLSDKKICRKVSNEMPAEEYMTDILQKIAAWIYEKWEQDEQPDAGTLINTMPPEEAETASQILCIDDQYDSKENAAEELILSIKKDKIELLLAGETNPAKIAELIKMRDKLGRK